MLKKTALKNRKGLSRGNTPLKRSRLSPISKNRDVQKDKEENAAIRAKDMEFYLSIWNSRSHYCYECDVRLYLDNFHAHHILFKSQYPQYRYLDENIKLLCFCCHDQTHLDMKKTPRIYEYYLELLNKYVNFVENT